MSEAIPWILFVAIGAGVFLLIRQFGGG